MTKNVYILEGARTAFGSFGGGLSTVDPTELGVAVSKEALKRSNVKGEDVDFAYFGNVIHSSKNAPYISRHIALKAGLSQSTNALTVSRVCGSGMQSVISAAQSIMLGDGHVALAGGVESMSLAPYAMRGNRFGTGIRAPKIDDMLWEPLTDEYIGAGMGVTAENLAVKYSISREEQDEYAYLSHQRAIDARDNGRLAEEIVPFEVKTRRGTTIIDTDEQIRDDTTVEKLAKLRPAFKKDGTVTGGNASGMNDGAAAVIVASEDYVKNNDLTPLARIVSYGIAGVDPEHMGIGPVPAVKQALEKADMSLEDIDLFELNEAFSAQALAVEKELGLDRNKVNVNGGAIALGHPIGVSGTRVLYTLIKELKRQNKKYGIASLCIGGGQGIAMLVEVI